MNEQRIGSNKFAAQRQSFRRHVEKGLGFSSSALFPPDILPSIESQPLLARCMVPSFSEEALPDAALADVQTTTKLSVPRPGLGCGFSEAAFNAHERSALPSWLMATGTSVSFNTGSIASGSALHCPFMTFERTFSSHDYHLEVTSNQCAVSGAWCMRSLQMLYARASSEHVDERFKKPSSFSCCIDNHMAVINYHWIDDVQAYCMAPVIRFELKKDDHYDHFLLWIEAIGQWATHCLLPEIKQAINIMHEPTISMSISKPSLRRLDTTKGRVDKGLLSALQMTYDQIAWDVDNGNLLNGKQSPSAISSSTASHGTPMISESILAKLEYPPVPRTHSLYLEGLFPSQVRFRDPLVKDVLLKASPWTKPPPPLPMQTENSELVMKRRLGHALDEIRDLQSQVEKLKLELDASQSGLQNEVASLREAMSAIISKKERNCVHSPERIRGLMTVETQHCVDVSKSVVTTPTEPRPNLRNADALPRKRSNLHNVLSLDTTTTRASVKTRFQTPVAKAFSFGNDDGDCEDDNCDDDEDWVDTFKTPMSTLVPASIMPEELLEGQVKQALENKASEVDTARGMEQLAASGSKALTNIVAGHLLSAFVPASMIKVVVLGCLVDYCMMSMNTPSSTSVSDYLCAVFRGSSV